MLFVRYYCLSCNILGYSEIFAPNFDIDAHHGSFFPVPETSLLNEAGACSWKLGVLIYYTISIWADLMGFSTQTVNYICKQVCVFQLYMSFCKQVLNWIWFLLIQKELDAFVTHQNSHWIQKQYERALPSRNHPDHFYENPEDYGGEDCLIEVDMEEIDELLDNAIDRKEWLCYIDKGSKPLIAEAYISIGSAAIKLGTAWTIFLSTHGIYEWR